MNKKRFLLGAITATLIGSSCYAISMEAAPEMGLFKKKKKKTDRGHKTKRINEREPENDGRA